MQFFLEYRVQSTTAMQRANQRLSLTSLVYLFTKQSYTQNREEFLAETLLYFALQDGLEPTTP